jgi:hypothetical protein
MYTVTRLLCFSAFWDERSCLSDVRFILLICVWLQAVPAPTSPASTPACWPT